MVETCEHSSLYHVIYFILLSLSFYSHFIPSIHILSHSAIIYHAILSALILIPFNSLSLLFYTIVHSIFTLFIIEFVMVDVNYSIHLLIHYSSSSFTLTSYCLSTIICSHSLPIHSISSHSYSCHITSFIYCSSLSLPLSLDYLLLISLAILFHSLFHSIIPFHSSHSHTHHTIHHSTLCTHHSLFYPFTIYTIHSTTVSINHSILTSLFHSSIYLFSFHIIHL